MAFFIALIFEPRFAAVHLFTRQCEIGGQKGSPFARFLGTDSLVRKLLAGGGLGSEAPNSGAIAPTGH